MRISNTIKIITGLSMFVASHAFAEEWLKVQQSDQTESRVHEKLRELGLFCEVIAGTFDKSSFLGSCREIQNPDSEIGLYTVRKTGESYSTNLLFRLGDASKTAFHEFHSPKTVLNHLESKPKNSNEEKIIFVDVKDEGSCYATEIFGLKNGVFNHLGSIELVTLEYSVNLDTPGYETRMECLGKYGNIGSEKNVTTIHFSAPKIYKIDPAQGNLIALKQNELQYHWTSSKLTRIK